MPSRTDAASLRNLSATLSTAGQSSGGGSAAYQAIRANYLVSLASVASDYLKGGNARSTLNVAQRVMVEAYGGAADAVTGGQLEPEALQLFNAEVSAERGYLAQLWDDLKRQKDEGNKVLPAARIELFGRSLDALVNQLTLSALKNAMLEFFGTDGVHSCRTCRRLQGQVHRASWWLAHELVPGQPGNPNFECGGWLCQHRLRNVATGEVVTL